MLGEGVMSNEVRREETHLLVRSGYILVIRFHHVILCMCVCMCDGEYMYVVMVCYVCVCDGIYVCVWVYVCVCDDIDDLRGVMLKFLSILTTCLVLYKHSYRS